MQIAAAVIGGVGGGFGRVEIIGEVTAPTWSQTTARHAAAAEELVKAVSGISAHEQSLT
jgi:hypothetical protein